MPLLINEDDSVCPRDEKDKCDHKFSTSNNRFWQCEKCGGVSLSKPLPNKQPLNWEVSFDKHLTKIESSIGWNDLPMYREEFKAFIRTVRSEALEQGRKEVLDCLPTEKFTMARAIKYKSDAGAGHVIGWNSYKDKFQDNLKEKGII